MIQAREARITDIENIMLLEKACFNEFTQESEDVYMERIICFPQGFIILEDSKRFIGAVSSEIWDYTENILRDTFSLGHSIRNSLSLYGTELYISSIGIFPEYRKKGYGKILFSHLIDNIKRKFPMVKSGILMINEEWGYARRIYIENGFKDIAIFEDFFIGHDNSKKKAIIMRNMAF